MRPLESEAEAVTGFETVQFETVIGLEVHAERMRANVGDQTLSEAARLGLDVHEPAGYLGSVDVFVDRALALYRG